MAILVVCPGCKSRFQVGDQFAGKSGSCPKCKGTIKIPTAAEQVKIHAPEQFASGGKNAEGKLVAKPILRAPTQFKPVLALSVAGTALVVLLMTWLLGDLFKDSIVFRAIGLLAVAPPLALGGYLILREGELEPYRGRPLVWRTAVCSAAYAATWGIFAFVAGLGMLDEVWMLLAVFAPLVVVGALVAYGCFDLDFGNACWHYGLYLGITIFLRWVAGMGWIWNIEI